MDAFRQLKINLARSPAYEAEGDDVLAAPDLPVRLFAFYLPQFHPIPENDEWWGKGFTEWTNVSKALPRFEGHYQPRLPSDLGFYDLRLPETVRQQVALAKRYGIAGFCFHWYWFGGRRLLEKPLEVFLAQRDLDFPFFINWANENWTRRWDGSEHTVLMKQEYSEADDLAVADAFLELMKDARYLRVDGRPVVMLYRATVLPDAKATIDRWRRHFAESGERDPIILMPQVFDELDPRPFGMDAAVQFPPHCAGPMIPNPERTIHFFDGHPGGGQYHYATVADQACERSGDGYPLFRGICPSWDNEARKPNGGYAMIGASPRNYGSWLGRIIKRTLNEKPLGTNLLFVNAWNEWAEGAHLEPDRHFGHAYLRQTCRALNAARDPDLLDRFIREQTQVERDAGDTGIEQRANGAPTGRGGATPAATTAPGSPDENAKGLIGQVNADRYDGHTDDPAEVAGILRAWMPRDCRVLDVGCGTGSVTVIANRYKNNEIVCVEPDAGRAAIAQGRNLYVHGGNLDASFVRSFGRFDVVMLSDVLEHLPDPSNMLATIRDVLVPGGTFLLSVPNVAHWTVRLSLLMGRFEYTPTGIRDATHLRWFTSETIQRLMRDSGFDVIRIAQTAGQDLPEYQAAPWRWMSYRVRRKLIRVATNRLPLLFGCQHVLMCRLRDVEVPVRPA